MRLPGRCATGRRQTWQRVAGSWVTVTGNRPEASRPWTRSRAASALRMSRREMLGERQVAAPLMARRAAYGTLRLAHRRFQPGEGVGI